MPLLLLLLSTTSTGTTLLTGLVSHWPMDEASGNAVDAHGSNDLTLTGTNQGQDPIDSTPARGFEYDVLNDFSIADNADLSFSNDQAFTFIVRCKFESTGSGTIHLLQKDGSNSTSWPDWGLWWRTDVGFRGYHYNVSAASATVSDASYTSLTPGNTYIVAWGHDPDGDTAWIRVNGGTRISIAWSTGTDDFANSNIFRIGAASMVGGTRYNMDGAIGPVSFWKRSLSDDEIDDWTTIKGNYDDFEDITPTPSTGHAHYYAQMRRQ